MLGSIMVTILRGYSNLMCKIGIHKWELIKDIGLTDEAPFSLWYYIFHCERCTATKEEAIPIMLD